ncbi:MAG: cytidylate kinase [Candidatus Pacebacteria bacterium RIFCSPLOWO2_01_FULL_47_12]|nr:MAG: cytidylate kinase [Candidatus Pacebacteria bacterium RIFCSPLOWO2_01_FULL_47_12]
MPNTTPFHLAIDGPVAAGKGTVSRLVADRLAFLYVDTGAMYRVAAFLALEAGANLADEAVVTGLIAQVTIEMHNPLVAEKDGRLTTVVLNGDDVSWKIRTEAISAGASTVAAHPKVRAILVKKQQAIAKNQDVVMEGRDITYRVLPEAQLKIFLTGSDVIRATRRHLQLLTRGQDITYAAVLAGIKQRDDQDIHRVTDPLKKIPEAWEIDTSELSIEQVVDVIVARVQVMRSV